MLFGDVFGVFVALLFLWNGVRAIFRQSVVWRPRGSRKPDSAFTYTGREAIIIGTAFIVAALFFGSMAIHELLQAVASSSPPTP